MSLGGVGEALDLEALGRLEEGRQILLVDVDLPAVHEGQQRLQVPGAHISHEDDGVLAGVPEEERLEVRAAGGEDDLVCGEGSAVAGEGYVCEGLLLVKLVEDGDQVALVVVPLEEKSLSLHPAAAHRPCGWTCRSQGSKLETLRPEECYMY